MRKVLLLCVIVYVYMMCCPHGRVSAQDIRANAVQGNRYDCIFYSAFDNFESSITFSTMTRMSLDSFRGFGVYIPIIDGFVGLYFSVDESIGEFSGDINILMTGGTIGSFIAGTGIIIMEYSMLSPMVFYGLMEEPIG